jgi:aerobic carbon-monoxide dehydrogenase large subunit
MDTSVEEVDFRDGLYVRRGTNRTVSILSIIDQYRGLHPHPHDTDGELPLARAFPGGAHVAEVEIDPQTGTTEVIAYTAVDDIGYVVHPVLAAGQLQGGVTQGVGQVLGEQCCFDPDTGQLLSASFMDYAMPRADGAVSIRIIEHSTLSPTNPLGAKGAGEAGTIGALPAAMNAVVSALRLAGVMRLDVPASPSRVWGAIVAGLQQPSATGPIRTR